MNRCVLLAFLPLMPWACGPTADTPVASTAPNVTIRVRLEPGVSQVALSASGNPTFSIGDAASRRELLFPPHGVVAISRQADGWHIGGAVIGGEIITFWPPAGGVLSVNQSAYRGAIRLVPVELGPGQFDVVNDVSVDDYLKGVLACELYHSWNLEAYKSQAVVARTYALYHSHTEGLGRYWDVWPDERSQMYGGISGETDKSRAAVDQTAGLVLTYGQGDGTIFEAFFSSDSGGVTQSASDAFGTPEIPPLSAHVEAGYDSASPYHNWGPISIAREEFTRRMRAWAARRDPPRPEAAMALVSDVQAAAFNSFGRTRAFRVTDANNQVYILTAEEMRSAFNVAAAGGAVLPSSFCKAMVSPSQDSVVFFDGHGFGHGVGMSQWAAQERATAGDAYDAILLSSYPQAKLVKAY